MRPLFILGKGEILLGVNGTGEESLPILFQELFPELSPKYIDPLSLMAGMAAKKALDSASQPLEADARRHCAVVLGTGFGALESSVAFDQQALLKGPNTVNPMDFPNTVANAAGSRIGIWLQLKGPNVTLTNGGTSLLDALGFAWEGLNSGLFQRCLVGAAEKIPNFLRASAPVGDGAILFLGTGEESSGTSFGVEDFLSIQWKRDGTIPLPFRSRLDDFWGGVEWAALPEGSPLGPFLPDGISRGAAGDPAREQGMGGRKALEDFFSSGWPSGVVASMAAEERRVTLVKLSAGKGKG